MEKKDYYDENGYLVCGKCHTRKQRDVTFPTLNGEQKKTVRVEKACECKKKEREESLRKQSEWRLESLRRDGIIDPLYSQYLFEKDDNRAFEISQVCRRYVENWKEMLKENIGILFYGGVGTGKTFLACCIANALIEKFIPAHVTNFPRILNDLQGYKKNEKPQEIIDKLNRYKLLVIDDLGVERDTAFSVEQVYNVIDSRYRTGMPVIISTNLSIEDFKTPPSLAHARIYDRVLEMCPIRLKLTGESRRIAIANARKMKARKLLGLN